MVSVLSSAFREKYGPWALVTGASDGTGAAFALQLAAMGLDLILVARRLDRLDSFAQSVRTQYDVRIQTASIDLYEEDAAKRVLGLAVGREVGLFVSNAGADTSLSPMLDAPFEVWRKLITRNVLTVAETAHGLAGAMRSRRRGGLILMSSGTALGGQPGVAVYSATKAFDLNLAESLWAELRPYGVDVLSGVCPAMDTPTLHRCLSGRGLTVPGLYDPEEVVRSLIRALPDGPLKIFPFGPGAADAAMIERARRDRAESMIEIAKMFTGSA